MLANGCPREASPVPRLPFALLPVLPWSACLQAPSSSRVLSSGTRWTLGGGQCRGCSWVAGRLWQVKAHRGAQLSLLVMEGGLLMCTFCCVEVVQSSLLHLMAILPPIPPSPLIVGRSSAPHAPCTEEPGPDMAPSLLPCPPPGALLAPPQPTPHWVEAALRVPHPIRVYCVELLSYGWWWCRLWSLYILFWPLPRPCPCCE